MLMKRTILVLSILILVWIGNTKPSGGEAPPKQISTTTSTTQIEVETPEIVTTTTVTVPVVTTTLAPKVLGDDMRVPENIRGLIHQHFDQFGVEVSAWMTHIVWRESNGQPDAWNHGSGCYGLTQQALPLHHARYEAHGWDWQTSWMDADKNLTIASEMYRDSGSGPWRL